MNFGYAPQFDATLALLTAREHLELYARLRGATVASAAELAKDLLRRVGLTKHADKPSYALSGGNRRKLSVGIALVSAPAVILLDEPSTGMDAGARRSMWDLLQAERAGRSIVLTSHSMEGVEATCGRVAVMVDGSVRTIGSLQELKQLYGTGYTASFRVHAPEALESLEAFVRESLPDSSLAERGTLTAKFFLPHVGGESQPLSAAFALIERELALGGRGRVTMGGVAEYAVAQCSLEDVFLRFAASQEGTEGLRDRGGSGEEEVA